MLISNMHTDLSKIIKAAKPKQFGFALQKTTQYVRSDRLILGPNQSAF